MRRFTDEEFETMVSELTDPAHSSFHMLCVIADKSLRSWVKHRCATDSALAGRGVEDDIMQDIFIRLIKTTLVSFLLKNDGNGETNRHPDKFKSWMFKVAERIVLDTRKALIRKDNRAHHFGGDEDWQFPDDPGEPENELCRRETLAAAFAVVLDADVKVCKVLTWLAQSLFILKYDLTRIQSNAVVIAAFSEKTLFEMRDSLFACAADFDWLVITPAQQERIERALCAEYEGKPIGEYRYREFFMKRGGKASISDWVNRMDQLIGSRIKR